MTKKQLDHSTKKKVLKIDQIKIVYFHKGKQVGSYDATWGPETKITSKRLMGVEHDLVDNIQNFKPEV